MCEISVVTVDFCSDLPPIVVSGSQVTSWVLGRISSACVEPNRNQSVLFSANKKVRWLDPLFYVESMLSL